MVLLQLMSAAANVSAPRFLPTFAPFLDPGLGHSDARLLMQSGAEAGASAVETMFSECDLLVSVAMLMTHLAGFSQISRQITIINKPLISGT